MSANLILQRALDRGIYLYLQDGKLKFKAKQSALDAEFKAELMAHKDELISLLTTLESKESHSPSAPQQNDVISSTPRKGDDNFPLSYAQRGLWFVHQYRGATSAYNLGLKLSLEGDVDVEKFLASVSEIYKRHEVLRTTFTVCKGDVRQCVSSSIPSIDRLTLSAQEFLEFCRVEQNYCFSLEGENLCRIHFIECEGTHGKAQTFLVLNFHHAIADRWSVGLFTRDLLQIYKAKIHGGAANLPKLSIQYTDYSVWEQQRDSDDMFAEHIRFWKDSLVDLPECLTLPYDNARPAEQSFSGGYEEFGESAEWIERLKTLAEQRGATLFMAMISVFAMVLQRYSGQQNLAIGTPVSNRERLETRDVMGFFINPIVVPFHFKDDTRFVDVLDQCKSHCLQAFQYQDLPFEKLVEHICPERSLSHSPVFQVSFSLLNTPVDESNIDDLKVHSEALVDSRERQNAIYDMVFNVSETDDGVYGGIEYNNDLFHADTIKRLLGHYRQFLQGLVLSSEQKVLSFDPLTQNEYARQVLSLNSLDNVRPFIDYRSLSLAQRFADVCQSNADAIAIADNTQCLSYAELDRRATRLAQFISRRPLRLESRIGICLERGPELAVAILAVVKAGHTYVPLDPHYPDARLQSMLSQSKCALVISESHIAEALECLEEWPSLLLDSSLIAPYLAADIEEQGGLPGALDLHPLHLAYVMYTSGSTGEPKGSCISHTNIARLVDGDWFNFSDHGRLLCAASFSFDAFTFEFWSALLHGGTCVFMDLRETLDQLGESLTQQAVDAAWLTSALFNQIVASDINSLSSLKTLLVGGEALSLPAIQKTLATLPHLQLINGYGPTENTTFSCTYSIEPGALSKAASVPIGRPISHSTAYIVDAQLALCPEGVVGEVLLGGAGLARAYEGQARLTAEKFIPHPFAQKGEEGARVYRSGDLARYTSRGLLDYVGRVDQQIKLRGFRIEVSEVEKVLQSFPGVKNVAVRLSDAPDGQSTLAAYLCVEDSGFELDELRSQLRLKLPEFMCPGAFVILDVLPLSPNGKVDRGALPSLDDSTYTSKEYVEPRTALEKKIHALWMENLNVKRISVNENYFSLGGDSIRCLSLITAAKEQGIIFSVKDLFTHNTIESLSTCLTQKNNIDGNALGAALSDGEHAKREESIDHTVKKYDALFNSMKMEYLQQHSEPTNAVDDVYPMSQLQQGMVFHSQRNPSLRLYCDAMEHRVNLPWRQQLFISSVASLVAEHEILRTVFIRQGALALQVVRPSHNKQDTLPIEIYDLREKSSSTVVEASVIEASVVEVKARQILDEDNQGDIALDKTPWQLGIVLLNQNEFILNFRFHHALMDGWSHASFISQLLAHYKTALNPTEQDTNEYRKLYSMPKPPYRTYIALEQEALKDATHREFWQSYLRGVRTPWWSKERQANSEYLYLEATQQQCRAIQALSETLCVQEKSVWAALYFCFLHYLDGHLEVCGSLVSHARPEVPNSEKTLGLFLVSLPLRVQAIGRSWNDLIRDIEGDLNRMQAHRYYPLSAIQESTGVDFSASIFNYTHFHVYEQAALQDELKGRGGFEDTNYCMNFHAAKDDSQQRCRLYIAMDPEIFSHAQRRHLEDVLPHMLVSLCRAPKRRISPSDWWQSFLNTRGKAPGSHPSVLAGIKSDFSEESIHGLFEKSAEAAPDAVAIVKGQYQFSYSFLNEIAGYLANKIGEEWQYGATNSISNASKSFGVKPCVIAIACQRSVEGVAAMLAVLKLGCAFVYVDVNNPSDRIRYYLEDSGASLLLVDEPIADLDNLSLKQITIDPSTAARRGALSIGAQTVNFPSVDANRSAYIIYTSGSTGSPKGVTLAHRGLVSLLHWASEALEEHDIECVLASTAFSFDLSLYELFLPLSRGRRCVLIDSILDLSKESWRESLSLVNTVPSAAKALLEQNALPKSLKVLNLAGEALASQLVTQLYQQANVRKVFDLYGPSEGTTYSTYALRQANAAANIGGPVPNTTCYVLNQHVELTPANTLGELYLSGVGLAQCYHAKPRQTALRFIPNPFSEILGERMYRTGDLVRVNSNNQLEYHGREDHQIKLRGFRIELGEVESIARESQMLDEAVAVLQRDGRGDTSIVLYFREKNLRTVADTFADTVADTAVEVGVELCLRQYLEKQLPHYMWPSFYMSLEQFPLNRNGKIDRNALPNPLIAPSATSCDQEMPGESMSDLETQIHGIWREFFRRDRLSKHDSFFSLGGNSLSALQLLAEVEAQLGMAIPLDLFFTTPNIVGLAENIETLRYVNSEREEDARQDLDEFEGIEI